MAELTRAILEARVRVSVADWRAAIKAACQPLLDAGAIEERYVQRCIEIVQAQGPYIVLAPGLALAHARPEDGVNRLCLAAITLREPVRFGHPDNDPVEVVFAFGSPDADEHVGLLTALAGRIQAGLDRELRAVTSDAEARKLLEPLGGGGKHCLLFRRPAT
jgi:ascorbate PTS system EIIA or EIIAB component